MSNRGLETVQRVIADECVATDEDVETLSRLLAVYEAAKPLIDPTYQITQLEWNGVMSRLRFAVSEFEAEVVA